VDQKEHQVLHFCIVWKTRCNNSLKRDDILPPLCDYIFSKVEHITDYNNPELVVNIEVTGNMCCIGLLKNFFKFKKYNIDLLVQNTTSGTDQKEKEPESSEIKTGEISEENEAEHIVDDSVEKKINCDKEQEDNTNKEAIVTEEIIPEDEVKVEHSQADEQNIKTEA